MKLLLSGTLVLACLTMSPSAFPQTKSTSNQEAGNCSVNIIGNSNTASVQCSGIDSQLAKQMQEILNRVTGNGKSEKDISTKLDQIIQQLDSSKIAIGAVYQGDCSVLQVGGSQNRAQGGSCAPKYRVLDIEHADKFSAALQGGTGLASIFTDGTDLDVIPLAIQICSFFKEPNWHANCVGVPNGTDMHGMELPANLIGLHCYNVARQISQALNDAGLPCVDENSEFRPFGPSGISVGLGSVIMIGNAAAK